MQGQEAEWAALADVMSSDNPYEAMQELKTVVRADMFSNRIASNIFKLWAKAEDAEHINLLTINNDKVGNVETISEATAMLVSSVPAVPIAPKILGKYIQDEAVKRLFYKKASNGEISNYADLAAFTEQIEQYQNFDVDNTDLITEYREYIGREREYIDLLKNLKIQAETGQMIVIAGRPGMGKTALATNMMSTLTLQRVPVALISLEMRRTEVFERMVNRMLLEPKMTQETALEVFNSNLDVFDIRDDVRSGIENIELEIGRQADAGKRVVVVDYLQLITSKGVSRYEQVSDISRRLKLAAMKHDVLLIALAQLNRAKAGEKKNRPQLTDLRDSGSIEQDADKVILLHSDDYYQENVPSNVDLDLIVAKNRQGGQHTFKSFYDREYQAIAVRKS
ncbi:DnaB-like helicase C-terminal domain-containing protein [Weissella paramesenteroides]|uniref:DnaB-like helicase C-terminal domain-containing protein n=1 Tax=Weissella paramesenteroides TaxID=1249 RepID=UPI00123AC530|nr:DnaB-like helicase C-terminal domain-containing protein [Weissella paramesenteroides]KAA8446958.1 hypothetical protein FKV72_03965 [Weissella paramesenteroides]KAA8450594.1 hypothetical protein FKV71_08655 [Weissella paramesenteroides]